MILAWSIFLLSLFYLYMSFFSIVEIFYLIRPPHYIAFKEKLVTFFFIAPLPIKATLIGLPFTMVTSFFLCIASIAVLFQRHWGIKLLLVSFCLEMIKRLCGVLFVTQGVDIHYTLGALLLVICYYYFNRTVVIKQFH